MLTIVSPPRPLLALLFLCSVLHAGEEPCVADRAPLVLEGTVLGPRGTPVEGARVSSSAGGETRSGADGRFRLETLVALDAESIAVTASIAGERLGASASVRLASAGTHFVGALRLAPEPCTPGWLPTFGEPPGTDGWVTRMEVLDDGSGPALYVCGSAERAGDQLARGVARWSGSGWQRLGGGHSARINDLAVFDDGSGPALFAGGTPTLVGGSSVHVARWDGAGWTGFGYLGTGKEVQALAVFDDGSGPALFAADGFELQRWDGSSWSVVSGDVRGVNVLAVLDDGNGPALFAAGYFTSIAGVPANAIARWDGTGWSALGSGLDGGVRALVEYDDGSGPALWAAGSFEQAGGVPATCVARWDGTRWSAAGFAGDDSVWALAVLDDGGGDALFVASELYASGDQTISRFDGAGWTTLPGEFDHRVYALAAFDGGRGEELYAGGAFVAAGGAVVDHFARFDGAAWRPSGYGVDARVTSLAVHDDGGGAALYAGGPATSAGALPGTKGIARWEGGSWSSVGGGVTDPSGGTGAGALVVHDEGCGPALFAGGLFRSIGGVDANQVAKWDGTQWRALGAGLGPSGSVDALETHRVGGVAKLFVGGSFAVAGGHNVASWDGSSWSPLGSGTSSSVEALKSFDDGSGPALFAAGFFQSAGGVPASRIAKWDGVSWRPLGSGTNDDVFALAVHDDGSGPALYVGGSFTMAGGVPASRLARWDGVAWSAVGGGVAGLGIAPKVQSLAVHDDGSGPALYVGGFFLTAGGVAVRNLARWSGAGWQAVGAALNGGVHALASAEEGGGPALYAGGRFLGGDSSESFIARWACPDDPPRLSCPAVVHALDRVGTAPGEGVAFAITVADDRDPSPSVVCVPPSGSFFPRGTTMVTCTATDAAGNQSSCEFPVRVELEVRSRPR